MFAAAAPLLAAGTSLVGGLAGNASSAKQAKSQQRFQERMSNTAWQRGTADMKAAGLNPMLAFAEGPASAPPGAMAPQQDVLTPAAKSALDYNRQEVEQEVMYGQAASANSQAKLNASIADKTEQERENLKTINEIQEYDKASAKALHDFYQQGGGAAKGAKEFLPLIIELFKSRR